MLSLFGCQQAAPPATLFSRETFQQEVLDPNPMVFVAFSADEPDELEMLEQARRTFLTHSRARLPWVSALTSPEDWVHQDHKIRQTPVLIAFDNGKPSARLLMPFSEAQLSSWLSDLEQAQRAPRLAAGAALEVTLTDDAFDEFLAQAKTPVVIDFWAEWCGPCKLIEEPLRLVAADYAGKVTVAKVNIDKQRKIAARYVTGPIPLLVLLHDGREIDRISGSHSGPSIRSWLDRQLEHLPATATP